LWELCIRLKKEACNLCSLIFIPYIFIKQGQVRFDDTRILLSLYKTLVRHFIACGVLCWRLSLIESSEKVY